MSLTQEETEGQEPGGRRTKLAATLDFLCHFAVDILGVAHSGFVRFDNFVLLSGSVRAHYPQPGFEGLLGQRIVLGVPAEQQLLDSEDGIEIPDVEEARPRLGEVADLLLRFGIKSLYIVKVRAHGQVIGSFSLDSLEPRSFDDHQKALCHSLARMASLAIENALSLDWLNAFSESTAAMISHHDVSELPSRIAALCARLFEVPEAGIYERRADSVGEYLVMTASTLRNPGITLRRPLRGMAWQIVDRDVPYLETPDYSTYEHRAEPFREAPDSFGSVLEVPMVWRDERVGVFFVGDLKGRQFTPFDASLLRRFADIATLAIQRGRLLARVQALSDASSHFTGGLESGSLEVRLTQIARYATKILDAEMCGVLILRQPRTLTLEASDGHREGTGGIGRTFQLEDGRQTGLTGAIAHRLWNAHRVLLASGITDRSSLVKNLHGTDLSGDRAVRGAPDASKKGQCCSLLVVPLIVKSSETERFLGILRLSNKNGASGTPGSSIAFDKEDEWALRIFADAAANAIEGAELFRRLENQRLRLQQIADAVKPIAEALAVGNQRAALHGVVEGVRAATACDAVTLNTKNPKSGQAILESRTSGLSNEARAEDWRGRADESAVGRLLRSKELSDGDVHVAPDSIRDPVMRGPFVAREGIVSSAAVRISASNPGEALTLLDEAAGVPGRAYVGALFVSYRSAHTFTVEEKAVIELFGRLAGVGIHNQQLSDEQAAEVEVQKALYDAALDLSRSLDLTSTFSRIAATAYSVAVAAKRRVCFTDVRLVKGEHFDIVAAYPVADLDAIRGKAGPFPRLDVGIVGKALSQNEPFVVNDVELEESYVQLHDETRSELVVVLRSDGIAVGTINIESPDRHCFAETDGRTFRLFAALAVQAIRNATQYADLARSQQEKKLLDSVSFYFVKAGVIAHRYKGSVRLVRQAAASLDEAAKRVATANPLDKEIGNLNARLKELDDELSAVRFDPAHWRAVGLNQMLDRFFNQAKVFGSYSRVEVTVDASCTADVRVRLDQEMFNHVLHILGKNSVTGGAGRIVLRTEMEPSGVCRVLFEDSGAGVPPGKWAQLLDQYVEPESPENSGIGLPTAALIVRAFGGELVKIGSSERGTSFAIRLPGDRT